jgi:DMSO/TMAO reductase YedYZ molybdopterin-dependent catalytic subunit
LDLGVTPKIDLKDWKLEIFGLVENPLVFSWQDYLNLPQSALTADMHCVTAWSRYDNVWEGVKFLDIIALAKPKPEAKFIMEYGYDGYTVNIAYEDAVKDNTILAYKHDGALLPVEHGGPVRLIIPHLYAWKGSKWVSKIEFRDTDEPGFWELRGYHNRGNPWTEERYS